MTSLTSRLRRTLRPEIARQGDVAVARKIGVPVASLRAWMAGTLPVLPGDSRLTTAQHAT